jgi:hypothetical protein
VGSGSRQVPDVRVLPAKVRVSAMPRKRTYAEHEKLTVVREESQKLGEFLSWLNDQGVTLCKLDGDEFLPWGNRIEVILALYFGVDLDKLEQEKLAMLDEMRAAQVQNHGR